MSDRSRLRIVVLRVIVVAILSTLLGRLAYLQVAEGATYRKAAADNRIRAVITPAARGQVLDDRGVALVRNRTALVVSVTRSILRSEPDRGADVLARLSKVVGVPAEQIALAITPCGEKLKNGDVASRKTGCWNGSPLQPVPIKSYSSDHPAEVRRVLAIEEHAEDFPGVQARYAAVREYPHGSLGSHVLGYLGPLSEEEVAKAAYKDRPSGSLIGRAGVESVYDERLRGVDGVQRLVVDKDGTVTGTQGTVEARAGDNLVLSIDSGIQQVAEVALAKGIAAARARYDRLRGKNFTANKGTAIVVEVGTGRIVAMASNPTYDPTVFVGGISTQEYRTLSNDPGQPLLSNATQGMYSPGSTFKVVSTAAAVEAGNPLLGSYPCPPSFKVGNRAFRNFEGEYFGTINFRTTLVKSCDTVYYKLAYEQWLADGGVKNSSRAREVFPNEARSWGFGTKTGIDLPDERSGLITDRGYKQRLWDQTKQVKCARARNGYPEVAKTDPTRAAYLHLLAKEFCTDGYRYNAGDAALFAIGQGDVLVTPLQLAMAYSALANGGTLYEPRLAKGFLSADGSTYSALAPVKKGKLASTPAVLAYMRDALRGVPQPGGTAQTAFAGFPFGQVPVAGKTGTADVQGKAPISWFASFAPATAPKYAVVVMVPEAGTGGTTAAPIAREIYDAMYGFGGKKALLGPGGVLPSGLPVVRPDGTIAPPGTKVPKPAQRVLPTPATSTRALGGPLPWAEAVRRRSGGPT
ncbi:MAG: Peptidoglycan glycosyltransferase [Frankiales bacterium]|nr:Peptidoglycan glycosyltransferase [Frankiales bacterium]